MKRPRFGMISGLQLGSGGSRETVSQRRSSACGLFSRAEDKVKLSNDVIEQACTIIAAICRILFQVCPHLRHCIHRELVNAVSTCRKAASFSSARAMKRFP